MPLWTALPRAKQNKALAGENGPGMREKFFRQKNFAWRCSQPEQSATVTRFEDNMKPANQIELPEGEFTGLRIVQASVGGAKLHPNLMWVEQLKLLH